MFTGVTARFSEAVLDALEDALVGVRPQLSRLLLTLFCQGHALVEDVPGTGKTAAVRGLAAATGLTAGRVQGTPDLLPSQVTGIDGDHRGAARGRNDPAAAVAARVRQPVASPPARPGARHPA